MRALLAIALLATLGCRDMFSIAQASAEARPRDRRYDEAGAVGGAGGLTNLSSCGDLDGTTEYWRNTGTGGYVEDLDGGTTATFAAWVRPTASTAAGNTMLGSWTAGSLKWIFNIESRTGSTLRPRVTLSSGGTRQTYATTKDLSDDTWSLVVITVNGASDGAVYVDGDSKTLSLDEGPNPTFTTAASKNTCFGGLDTGSGCGNRFNGFLDSLFVIPGDALSQTEVNQLCCNQDSSCSGTCGWHDWSALPFWSGTAVWMRCGDHELDTDDEILSADPLLNAYQFDFEPENPYTYNTTTIPPAL